MDQRRDTTASGLDRDAILGALQRLSDDLGARGVTGEICLCGGAVMVLAFSARVSTRDVDAIFHPPQLIRELSARIGDELRLPQDWLNDGVKGFVSARHETATGNLPQFPNLRITMPVPEYLLAMKCMAARVGGPGGEQSDIPDIVLLVRRIGLKSPGAVLELVAQYYPAQQIPPRTRYLIEGLFEEGSV